VNADTARYARITHRLALGVSSEDDAESQALAELLQRRIVESIAVECAPYVTSDLLSQRLAQAVAVLSQHGFALRIADGGVAVEGCFCAFRECDHPAALLQRLLGAAVEPITTRDGRRMLQVIGVLDAASYTEDTSRTISRLRS
jgi:hypothetical protein